MCLGQRRLKCHLRVRKRLQSSIWVRRRRKGRDKQISCQYEWRIKEPGGKAPCEEYKKLFRNIKTCWSVHYNPSHSGQKMAKFHISKGVGITVELKPAQNKRWANIPCQIWNFNWMIQPQEHSVEIFYYFWLEENSSNYLKKFVNQNSVWFQVSKINRILLTSVSILR